MLFHIINDNEFMEKWIDFINKFHLNENIIIFGQFLHTSEKLFIYLKI